MALVQLGVLSFARREEIKSMAHASHHPVPVDGCFGCKASTIGFDGGNLLRRVPVMVEEGPRRGVVGGVMTEHRSGRVDAEVSPSSLVLQARTQENG